MQQQMVDLHPAPRFDRHVVTDYRYVLENTMQPFAAGDLFLGCTYLNDPTDDHAGLGRILQYDAEFKPKGVLWTQGHRHLVMGLRFAPDGVLWGFDIHTQTILRVDRYGRQIPTQRLIDRAFGTVAFARDGSMYFGETVKGTKPYWGSLMTFIPGSDHIGHGHIFHFSRERELLAEFPAETAQELSGFKGVTHLSLHPSERYVAYTTETGKRLMRYDVVERRQMPDLARIDTPDLYDRQWFIALDYCGDGSLLVTRGATVERYDEDGKVMRTYDLERFGYGFAQVSVCHDQQHAVAANIFTGIACKFALDSGEIVAHVQTDHGGARRSLAGIAEYAGQVTAGDR